MDIRIFTLLVLISVAGSFADFRSTLYRVRRNGLEEYGRPRVMASDEISRMKRETVGTSNSESTDTTKSTPFTATSTPKPSPTIASMKPDSISQPKSNSNPATSSTPVSSSTTSKPKSSPTTESASKPMPTGVSTAPKPKSTAPRQVSAKATEATTKSPSTKPSNSDKPSESGPTTPSPAIGSRLGAEDEDQQSNVNARPNGNMGATGSNPKPPNDPTLSSSVTPNFVPDMSRPFNSFVDPTFNSIPGPTNYAWTGTSNGPGSASSFASASSSGGYGGGFGGSYGGGYGGSYGGAYNPSPLANRGGFDDNAPHAANTANSAYVPQMSYMPNALNLWGYNAGGAPYFDPTNFAFPDYNLENIHRQMEENFRRLQAQFQQQQNALFDTASRIGTDGASNPGLNSAVSSISLGPNGGYQSGAINPAAPGIESRFGEEIPPPSGNSFGVFSSSSSKTVTGPDGKPISHKISTTGVNDNGKITFRTVQD